MARPVQRVTSMTSRAAERELARERRGERVMSGIGEDRVVVGGEGWIECWVEG